MMSLYTLYFLYIKGKYRLCINLPKVGSIGTFLGAYIHTFQPPKLTNDFLTQFILFNLYFYKLYKVDTLTLLEFNKTFV